MKELNDQEVQHIINFFIVNKEFFLSQKQRNMQYLAGFEDWLTAQGYRPRKLFQRLIDFDQSVNKQLSPWKATKLNEKIIRDLTELPYDPLEYQHLKHKDEKAIIRARKFFKKEPKAGHAILEAIPDVQHVFILFKNYDLVAKLAKCDMKSDQPIDDKTLAKNCAPILKMQLDNILRNFRWVSKEITPLDLENLLLAKMEYYDEIGLKESLSELIEVLQSKDPEEALWDHLIADKAQIKTLKHAANKDYLDSRELEKLIEKNSQAMETVKDAMNSEALQVSRVFTPLARLLETHSKELVKRAH